MILRPYHARHLALLLAQNPGFDEIPAAWAQALETLGPAWSAWSGADCVACAGLQVDQADEGRAVAWSILSPRAAAYIAPLALAARRKIEGAGLRRVEYHVLLGNRPGHRLAKSLGFVVEAACMSRYDPEGRDVMLYARVF